VVLGQAREGPVPILRPPVRSSQRLGEAGDGGAGSQGLEQVQAGWAVEEAEQP